MSIQLETEVSSNENISNFKILFNGFKIGVLSYTNDSDLIHAKAIGMDGSYLVFPTHVSKIDKVIANVLSLSEDKFKHLLPKEESKSPFFVRIKIQSTLGFEYAFSNSDELCSKESIGDFFVKKFDSLPDAEYFVVNNLQLFESINSNLSFNMGDSIQKIIFQKVLPDYSTVDLLQKIF